MFESCLHTREAYPHGLHPQPPGLRAQWAGPVKCPSGKSGGLGQAWYLMGTDVIALEVRVRCPLVTSFSFVGDLPCCFPPALGLVTVPSALVWRLDSLATGSLNPISSAHCALVPFVNNPPRYPDSQEAICFPRAPEWCDSVMSNGGNWKHT